MMPMRPRIREWIVDVSIVGGAVAICPGRGMTQLWGTFWPKYVTPPNFIERFFGITFESKIAQAKTKAQQWCDRENAAERRSEAAIKA